MEMVLRHKWRYSFKHNKGEEVKLMEEGREKGKRGGRREEEKRARVFTSN